MKKKFTDEEIEETVAFLTMSGKEIRALDEFERHMYPMVLQSHKLKAAEMFPYVWGLLKKTVKKK